MQTTCADKKWVNVHVFILQMNSSLSQLYEHNKRLIYAIYPSFGRPLHHIPYFHRVECVPDPSYSLAAKHFHFLHHTLYPLRFLVSFRTQLDHRNDREIITEIHNHSLPLVISLYWIQTQSLTQKTWHVYFKLVNLEHDTVRSAHFDIFGTRFGWNLVRRGSLNISVLISV